MAQCVRCGRGLMPGTPYCPHCGAPQGLYPPPSSVNTHTAGFLVLAFLIYLLWFRVNGMPVFPLGLMGGLVLGAWSTDIDRHFGKPSQLVAFVVLALLGAFIGFLIH